MDENRTDRYPAGYRAEPTEAGRTEVFGPLPPPSAPPPPPPAPLPPRSVAAAVLFNLTGLAIGYAYLSRGRRAALYLAGTIVLVVVAFLTDAADTPWLWRTIAVVWLLWMALDAWRLARRTPQPSPGRPRVVPVLVGVVAVLVVVGGYVGYGVAGRATFAAGSDAQARADCAGAVPAFDAVTGLYELTLSRDVPAAAQRRSECTAFTAVQQTERSGDLTRAATDYRAFRTAHPGSALLPFVHASLMRVFGTTADDLMRGGDIAGEIAARRQVLGEARTPSETTQARADLAAAYLRQAGADAARLPPLSGDDRVAGTRSAFDALLVVTREFGDTPSAAAVPQRMTDTFTVANGQFAAGQFCASLPVLDYAVTLPTDEAAGVVAAATTDRGKALYGCGLAEFRASHYDGALTQLDAFMAGYPHDPAAPQVLALIISSKVGRQAAVPMPVPAPVDGNSPGPNPITYYNLTPYTLTVLVAGPTAHTFTLPPCSGCSAEYPATTTSCLPADFAGKPVVPLRLPAGGYRDLITGPASASVNDNSTVVTVQNDYYVDYCLRVHPN